MRGDLDRPRAGGPPRVCMGETPPPTARSLPDVLEAILFASQKPVSAKEISGILKGAAEASKDTPLPFAKAKPQEIQDAIEVLENQYRDSNRSFEVRESAAGWQIVTKPEFAPWLRQLFPENRPARLSAPSMETLAIIAYKQPITRADIEAVRGVAVDGVMQTLLDRGLVRIAGRADIAGRPLLYETTTFFMEHFGLKNLDDLPNAAELRRVAVPTAQPPVTASETTAETPVPENASPTEASGEQAPEAESPEISPDTP